MNARPVALRAALIWRDEVMGDIVADTPRKITLGHKGRPTFVVPDVGLPAGFAIVTPGNRGYLLTLGPKMRGKICIDGKVQDVTEFVARGEGGVGPGGFLATPIGGRDWGVIELDEDGACKLFFQFVPVEAPLPSHTDLYISLTRAAAVAAYFMIGLVVVNQLVLELGDMTLLDWIAWMRDQLWAEWSWRGALLVVAGLTVFHLGWSLAHAEPEQQASTGFSVLLHGSLLIWTFVIYHHHKDDDVWPGPRELTGNYLVARLAPPPEEEVKPPAVAVARPNQEAAAAAAENREARRTATKGAEGASGGHGDTERARDPNARDTLPAPPKVGVFEDRNRKILDNIIDRNLATNLGKFSGIKGDLRSGSIGFGPGTGSGVGEGHGTGTTRGGKGKGPGGGGEVEGDFVRSAGPVDTGKQRPGGKCKGAGCKGRGPKPVQVAIGEMSGDTGGYTEDEINRVVRARKGVFRACYQKELNRSPGIGGKIVVKFKIGGDGTVQRATATGSSTLKNAAVQACVTSNVMRLRFPPKGAIANVTYPFLFSPGG